MKPLHLSRGRIVAFYATVIAAGLVTASAADIWPLRLVYNASASVPLGFYTVRDTGQLAAGDLVIARPPLRAERMLVERRYLGVDVPLVKQIGAVPGSTVCRDADRITIDATPAAMARDVDGLGRPLPRWTGCRLLGPGENLPAKLRRARLVRRPLFRPEPARDIIGKATPLWTW